MNAPTSDPWTVEVKPPAGLQPKAARTAQRLLEAAHELLCERPGGNIPVSELCARASANVTMVKYCFGSKDGLFDALLESVVERFVADLERLDRQELDRTEKLRHHIRAVVHNYVRYPYLNRLLNERFVLGRKEVLERLSRLFAIPTRDWYGRLLAEGRTAGEFRDVDPAFFFFTLLGAGEFMFSARPWMEQAFGSTIDEELLERFVDHMTTLCLSGIEAR